MVNYDVVFYSKIKTDELFVETTSFKKKLKI